MLQVSLIILALAIFFNPAYPADFNVIRQKLDKALIGQGFICTKHFKTDSEFVWYYTADAGGDYICRAEIKQGVDNSYVGLRYQFPFVMCNYEQFELIDMAYSLFESRRGKALTAYESSTIWGITNMLWKNGGKSNYRFGYENPQFSVFAPNIYWRDFIISAGVHGGRLSR
ncbi:MAG: hypothetical protein WC858_00775 [Parcubacteria group bacterium]